ncbi:cytochrome P450 [Streptomyces sp. CLV115]|uniref:cytochrome P450 n=1 Tax=Streptomyces sp. CLV115 TaxID=3138502 RepID=UPI00406C86ED
MLIGRGAANRDPEQFPSPDRLDLDRDTTGRLAFGHGIHRCVGAPLARAEAEIALRAVLTRFPAIRPAVPPGQLEWRRTRLVRGPVSLPLFTQGLSSGTCRAGWLSSSGCFLGRAGARQARRSRF